MGHPKRLLLVSEPKIQSHHEKGKLVTPVPSVSPRDSGSLLQEEKGRGTIGHPFLPSSLERKRALRKKREHGPYSPEPGAGLWGLGQ